MTGEVNLDVQSSKIIAEALSRIAASGEDNAKQIAVIGTTQEHLTKTIEKLADTTTTLVKTTERILSDKSHLEKDVIKTFDVLNDKISKNFVIADDHALRIQALEICSAENFGATKANSGIWSNWYKIVNVLIMMMCAAFSVGLYIKGTQHDITHPSHKLTDKDSNNDG